VDLSPSDAAIKAVGGLYSLSIQNGPADAAILALAKSAKVDVDIVSPADDLITISFHDLPFQKALERILRVADLKYREQDGLYVIGLSVDLQLMFPTSTEKELDAVYRCRHLDSDSLAQALAKVLPPQVKITQGPRYMSPGLDSGNDPSGLTGDQGLRALTATDLTFKVHDILLSGPADMVRRGITLARRFDRLRKQVRINIRVAEVEDNNVQNLGLSWMQSLNLSAKEQATSSDGTLVDGIRLGKFSHSPLVVNATLNALETKGKSKTLANPSLLLMDGERSFILSGQKLLYPKFTGKDQSGQSIYDVAELRVGIYLQVAVQIGLNNDIVMSIIPQVTNVVSFTNYNNGQYPTVSTREAQTTVHAVSGEMVVLGGLKSTLDSEDKDGIPFLKDIPVLGRLFSSTNKTNNKSELMIFLTPEIMNDPEEAKVPVKISRGEDH
jgi:type II secretory pathway component GspD/PulD (secretin)